MNKLPFHFLILILTVTTIWGQEVPKVVHFSRQDYRAQNQNWDIAQRKDLQMFFGNSGGLLNFNGASWQLFPAPSGQVIRAVSVTENNRVFVGGYATLGYWEATAEGKFEYHSLLNKVEGDGLGNEEIWHILNLGNQVLFQSFSTLYIYNGDTVKNVNVPGNIMFGRKINDSVIFPVINEGLYEFDKKGTFQKIPGSDIFKEKIVATILPFGKNEMLVCTQNSGIFKSSNGKFTPWEGPVNEVLKPLQLNKALQLSSGNYVFGTILSGIFITSPDGKIISHINQEKGLQNNTVLSLFQDRANGLWVGLDKGIDLVLFDSPLKYFQDKTGEIGAVYTAAIFDKKLYAGTNHGIFYKNHLADGFDKFRLLPGSQGQTWDLQVFDNQLIAGHNSGSFRLSGNQLTPLFTSTGVYTTVVHPVRSDILVQGTYTGIVVLKKDSRGTWQFSNGIEGFTQSARKLFFDKNERLWVLHPRQGLFLVTLDSSLRKATGIENLSTANGLPSAYNLDVSRIGEDLIVKSDSLFFTWDEKTQQFTRKTAIGTEPLNPGNYRLLSGRANEWFKAFPTFVQYFNTKKNTLRIPLPTGSEQIAVLADSSYLFCLDDGYIILPPGEYSNMKTLNDFPPPLITAAHAENSRRQLDDLSNIIQPFVFKPSENQLKFFFSSPNFTFQPAMRHRLIGFHETWSPFQLESSKEFTNLPPGDYEFQVQSELTDEIASFRFTIEPKWFQTVWAKVVYLCLLLATFWLLLKWHDRRMQAQERRLQLEKERELEQHRIEARNEILQTEILNKSRKLADTTMNLVRKNEMLMKIKEELEQASRSQKSIPPARAFTKMEHLIDEHLTSEDDWKVFESNFNQLHDQFFKRLKDQYPDLTPGDLRLAAYLKMNLSSKEIAPLLNISVRGVENKRYRLRQKMNLDSEVNLTEYLMGY